MHINSFPGGAFHFKSLARHFQGLSRGANQMRKNERNARFFFRFDWPSSPPVRPIRGRRSSIRLSIFADDVCAFLFRFFFFAFLGPSISFLFIIIFLFLFTSRRRRIRQCRLTFSRQRRRRTMFFLSKACPFPVKEKPRKQKIK